MPEKLFVDRKYKDIVPETVLYSEYKQKKKEGEISQRESFKDFVKECCSRKGFLDYIGEGIKEFKLN